MRYWNGHIILEGVEWKDLRDLWGDMLRLFFRESRQFLDEPETVEVIVWENMVDINHNRKPEGYNRDGRMKLVVPLSGNREFFIYRESYSDEVRIVTEKISEFLGKKGIKHSVEWNDMLYYRIKKRRR